MISDDEDVLQRNVLTAVGMTATHLVSPESCAIHGAQVSAKEGVLAVNQ